MRIPEIPPTVVIGVKSASNNYFEVETIVKVLAFSSSNELQIRASGQTLGVETILDLRHDNGSEDARPNDG